MKIFFFKPVILIMLIFIFGCSRREQPTIREILSSPSQQDTVINYIMNDYPMMMKFLDKCMSNDQAKSMMLGHWKMMQMMMSNSEMMSEIMKSDSTTGKEMMSNMIDAAVEDSVMSRKMINMMMTNDQMKKMMQEILMQHNGMNEKSKIKKEEGMMNH